MCTSKQHLAVVAPNVRHFLRTALTPLPRIATLTCNAASCIVGMYTLLYLPAIKHNTGNLLQERAMVDIFMSQFLLERFKCAINDSLSLTNFI